MIHSIWFIQYATMHSVGFIQLVWFIQYDLFSMIHSLWFIQYKSFNIVHSIQFIQWFNLHDSFNIISSIRFIQYDSFNTVHSIWMIQNYSFNTINSIRLIQYDVFNTIQYDSIDLPATSIICHPLLLPFNKFSCQFFRADGRKERVVQLNKALCLICSVFHCDNHDVCISYHLI